MILHKWNIIALASFLCVFSPQFSLSQTTNTQIMSTWKGHIDAGTAAEKKGNYTSAEQFFSLAMKEAEKFDQEGKYTVMSCRLLAELYEQERKYASAEPLRRKALTITEKALGPNSPYVATCLFKLAVLLEHEGKNTEAKTLAERASAIDQKKFGVNPMTVANQMKARAQSSHGQVK